jgi:septum formation protein
LLARSVTARILFRFNPNMPAMKLILASASPRRAEILTAAGLSFEIRAAQIDESSPALTDAAAPEQVVERLARAKAEDVAREIGSSEPLIILGADTLVVAGEEYLGKPYFAETAREMLIKLRGREHLVVTGFALLRIQDGQIRVGHETTRVWFSNMTDQEVDAYAALEEPLDKAGAYAIQGIAGRYIPRIEGCYFNVVGLPIARVWEAMKELGWPTS